MFVDLGRSGRTPGPPQITKNAPLRRPWGRPWGQRGELENGALAEGKTSLGGLEGDQGTPRGRSQAAFYLSLERMGFLRFFNA